MENSNIINNSDNNINISNNFDDNSDSKNLESFTNINKNDFNNKNDKLNPNDFIFMGFELFRYKEITKIGVFYSYTNKSVKGIFSDKTICMMNKDQLYAKIINKYGEKYLLYVPDVSLNNPYYIYIKYLFDFYDSCFNIKAIQENLKYHSDLEKEVDNRINKIDTFNNLIYNKDMNYNYSKQYYTDKKPTFMDIQNLLNKNQKALDGIEQIRMNNSNK